MSDLMDFDADDDSDADDDGSDDGSDLVDTMQLLHDVTAQVSGVYCSHANLPEDEW